MRKWLIYIALIGFLVNGCLTKSEDGENQETADAPESFLEDMPEKDRNLLLDPLEGVLEDLKESIDRDLSLKSDTIPLDLEGASGTYYVKLYEAEHAKIELIAEAYEGLYERHAWYFDRKGSIFYSTHQLKSKALEGGENQAHYKLYFDENGARLSAYGRIAYNGDELPKKWEAMDIPEALERYLKSKYLYIQ